MDQKVTVILWSLALFVLAGLVEIGGGWLVWQWLREHRSLLFGVFGGVILMLYGVIPTMQPEEAFGRVYAAYGGIFVVLSVFWGWRVDGWTPDRWDIAGALMCLAGVGVIMWAPRAG